VAGSPWRSLRWRSIERAEGCEEFGLTTIRDMELFVEVIHRGSFSAAGRHLGLSPASVSRHINALENALDARLLNRTSRNLTLTDAGQRYYEKVERILADIRDVHETVAQMQQTPRGTLRLHSRMLIGILHIVPALPRFMQSYPEIDINMRLSNFPADLIEQNLDLDIRIGSLTDSSLISRKLMSSERMICATPDYLERHPPICRPEDLAGHNCLTYVINHGAPTWRFLDPDGALTEIRASGNYQSDNGEALLMATLAGMGLGLMADWAVRDHIAEGRLVRLFPEYRVSHIEFENGVYAVYPQNRHLSAKVRVFIDFLVDLFKDMQAQGRAP
jgi:DNA-binding transcriptional LysR family regulator